VGRAKYNVPTQMMHWGSLAFYSASPVIKIDRKIFKKL